MVERQTDLATRYLGLNLSNPIIAASCGLTGTLEGVEAFARAGAGAIVLKSLFEEQVHGEVQQLAADSQASLWHPEAAEYIRAYGWENAVERYLALIRSAKQAVSVPIIASLHCVTPGAWLEFARRVQAAGADALELNVFVLPSDPRRSGEENERVYFDLVREVRRHVSLPIALKIGSYFSGLAGTLERLGRSGVSGLVLFNRYYQPDIDVDRLETIASSPLSSPEEQLLPLRWIAIMSSRVDCDLAASTGVSDGRAVVKQLLAGAAAVQVASAFYRHGHDHLGVMLREVAEWMRQHDFGRLADFRGHLRQDRASNPAAYERVQFMKMSVGIE